MLFENNIIKTPDLVIDENCGGYGKLFFTSFKKFPDRIALINALTDEFETYETLLQKCVSTAQKLQQEGFQRQDLIAICSNRENIDAVVPIIAGQFLGCITFSIDPALTVEEIAELVQQVEPKIIFVVESAKQLITDTLTKVNGRSRIVLFGSEFEKEFLKPQNRPFEPIHVDNLKDSCVIHFSSGTTGTPKPICLNHYYFLGLLGTYSLAMNQILQINKYQNRPIGIVSLRFGNWFWVSTSMEMTTVFSTGGCILLKRDFAPEELWKCIEQYHITDLFLTPLQCIEFSETKKPDSVDISCLAKILYGGYVLPKDYVYALRKLLPDVFIVQLYGMTELGSVTSFNSKLPEHKELLMKKPNSCGLPEAGTSLKVVNLDTGKTCRFNEPGELYVKSRKMFNGFYNRDAAESFDDEGYFRTGDLVYFDEDFCFYIQDRIKAILGWNDWLIYPHHIEKVLLQHPSVYNAVVIGVPHKIEGERLMGVVKLKKDAKVSEEALVKFVEARVEDHKRLREGVIFVDHLPTTVTGKINRLKVKQMILNNTAPFCY